MYIINTENGKKVFWLIEEVYKEKIFSFILRVSRESCGARNKIFSL